MPRALQILAKNYKFIPFPFYQLFNFSKFPYQYGVIIRDIEYRFYNAAKDYAVKVFLNFVLGGSSDVIGKLESAVSNIATSISSKAKISKVTLPEQIDETKLEDSYAHQRDNKIYKIEFPGEEDPQYTLQEIIHGATNEAYNNRVDLLRGGVHIDDLDMHVRFDIMKEGILDKSIEVCKDIRCTNPANQPYGDGHVDVYYEEAINIYEGSREG